MVAAPGPLGFRVEGDEWLGYKVLVALRTDPDGFRDPGGGTQALLAHDREDIMREAGWRRGATRMGQIDRYMRALWDSSTVAEREQWTRMANAVMSLRDSYVQMGGTPEQAFGWAVRDFRAALRVGEETEDDPELWRRIREAYQYLRGAAVTLGFRW